VLYLDIALPLSSMLTAAAATTITTSTDPTAPHSKMPIAASLFCYRLRITPSLDSYASPKLPSVFPLL
jgi:hypothetical protein